jgi:hypothetical protein
MHDSESGYTLAQIFFFEKNVNGKRVPQRQKVAKVLLHSTNSSVGVSVAKDGIMSLHGFHGAPVITRCNACRQPHHGLYDIVK